MITHTHTHTHVSAFHLVRQCSLWGAEEDKMRGHAALGACRTPEAVNQCASCSEACQRCLDSELMVSLMTVGCRSVEPRSLSMI